MAVAEIVTELKLPKKPVVFPPMRNDFVQPGDEIAHNLITVRLMQKLVPRAGINAAGDGYDSGIAKRRGKFPCSRIGHGHRIALTRHNINRQLSRRNRQPGPERIEQINPQLDGDPKAARRIGHVAINGNRIARKPVSRRPHRGKAAVISTEGQRMQQPAASARTDSQRFKAGQKRTRARQSARLAITARQNKAGQREAAFSRNLLRQKRSHRVAEQDHGRIGMLRDDVPVQSMKIIEAFTPTLRLGEKAKISRACRRTAMSPMIVGVDSISGGVECLRQIAIACGMLGHAMHDLHHGARSSPGPPLVNMKRSAVRSVQGERSQEKRSTGFALRMDRFSSQIEPLSHVDDLFNLTTRASRFLNEKLLSMTALASLMTFSQVLWSLHGHAI